MFTIVTEEIRPNFKNSGTLRTGSFEICQKVIRKAWSISENKQRTVVKLGVELKLELVELKVFTIGIT